MRVLPIVAAAVMALPMAAADAAVLVDTGLTDTVSIHAAYDEYFTCDENGSCEQVYELITSQASRFHLAVRGVADTITLAAAHQDGFDSYAIYADAGGLLLPDAAHRIWSTASYDNLLKSTPLTGGGYDNYYGVSRDTYSLSGLVLAAGDYWIVLSVVGPTIGAEPALFAGTDTGLNADQQYFDNAPGPYPFTNFTGPQASVLIDGTLAAIPEPASWALLIAGFGMVGTAARREDRTLRKTGGSRT